ncbi:MAG: YeeE/YedE thiosulfate transporter family protein [Pseudomonadota bacterium]
MLLEIFDTGLPVTTLHLLFGLALGALFGVAAQISRFCLRRAVAGDTHERGSAAAVWLTGLAVAIGAVQGLSAYGLIEVSNHRLLSTGLPVLAIIAGGVMFGVGMVLTRGCVSRLTVLGASGNLRALSVLVVFAIVAHATIKGVFAPVRTALGSVQVDLPFASLAEVPGAAWVLPIALGAAALVLARRFGAAPLHVALGAVIGLTAAAGWAGTSVLLMDEFEPLAVQSVAFTLPWTDTLFWTVASTAIPAGFGTGLIGGVLLGAFVSAALRGEFQAQSFSTPAETARYSLGGALMGMGGVLAGGCTVGAGLSGAGTLSLAALLALAAIIAGGVLAGAVQARPVAVPAE